MFNHQYAPTHVESCLDDIIQELHADVCADDCSAELLSTAATHGTGYLTGMAATCLSDAATLSGQERRDELMQVLALVAVTIIADEQADAAFYDDSEPKASPPSAIEAGDFKNDPEVQSLLDRIFPKGSVSAFVNTLD